MKFTENLNIVCKTFQILTIAAILFAAVSAGAAQTVISVAPFRSIELREGGHHIFLRHGTTQTVTLLNGSADCVRFTNGDGDRLVIDKNKARCARKDAVEIEIVLPEIAEVSVANGGIIQSRDGFPQQTRIKAHVSNGGIIDVRKIAAVSIISSVEQGGAIFVMPQTSLSASIGGGGIITYWGNPRLESSVRDGGAVKKGNADEADKPLAESGESMNCALSLMNGVIGKGLKTAWLIGFPTL